MLISIFSKEKIYAPADLLKDKQNLKEATNTNWKSIDSLKGKFVFVITDGTINNIVNVTVRILLNEYLRSRKKDAICFVAAEITTESELTQPKGISQENVQNIIFYNLQYQNKNLSEKINSANYVRRLYDSPETKDSYLDLIKLKINFVALHNFKIAADH